jgi:5'-phosphate synthase pdxT subunit
MIFLAKDVGPPAAAGTSSPPLAVMDVTVDRNAFGRQVDSFEADIDLALPRPTFPGGLYPPPKIEAVGRG